MPFEYRCLHQPQLREGSISCGAGHADMVEDMEEDTVDIGADDEPWAPREAWRPMRLRCFSRALAASHAGRRAAFLLVPLVIGAWCWTVDPVRIFNPQQLIQEQVATAAPALWCNAQETQALPLLSPADVAGPPVQVKVLTYNLEWWSLFLRLGGLGGSAGKLIAAAGKPQPFDLMAFQECQDPLWVLRDAGLLPEYTALQGAMSLCLAYHTSTWTAVAQGEEFIAEDMPTEYYGKRSAQWVRLRHLQTGKMVLFVNHHGPLSVNTGGICGGKVTAHNLLRMLGRSAVPGDSIILVGDFNANAASETIQVLSQYLYKAYNGIAYGGVDNMFTNVKFSQEAQNLGTGGSDHGALSVVFDIAGSALPPASSPGSPPVTTTLTTTSVTTTTLTPVTTAIAVA